MDQLETESSLVEGQSSWVDVTRDGGSSTPPVPPSPGRATPVASGQDQVSQSEEL